MSKIALIVPIHKQANNFNKILDSIIKQTILPHKVFLLLDRPKLDTSIENSEDVIRNLCNESSISEYIEVSVIDELPKYIKETSYENAFLAGYTRNIGIEKAIQSGCDIFIFTDGDCILQKRLVESHLNKLNHDIPVLSCGRRREQIYRWQDRREVDPSLFNLKLFSNDGIIINNFKLLENSLIVWSCNIGLNLKAVNLLRKFNKKYYNRLEVFSSEFNGKWGGEDGFLGIESFYCRIFITTISDKASGVEHIDHPRPTDKYSVDHAKHFTEQCNLLRKKVTISPMELDFFCH